MYLHKHGANISWSGTQITTGRMWPYNVVMQWLCSVTSKMRAPSDMRRSSSRSERRHLWWVCWDIPLRTTMMLHNLHPMTGRNSAASVTIWSVYCVPFTMYIVPYLYVRGGFETQIHFEYNSWSVSIIPMLLVFRLKHLWPASLSTFIPWACMMKTILSLNSPLFGIFDPA